MIASSNPQQQFMSWVENHIADALGFPVFSVGQEVLFECFDDTCLAVIHGYILSLNNHRLEISYRLQLKPNNKVWLDGVWHEELLTLNLIPHNLPTSRRRHDC